MQSPSRTYVVQVRFNNGRIAFRKFVLPIRFENTTQKATWYYFNMINRSCSGSEAISFEEYSDITEVESPIEQEE